MWRGLGAKRGGILGILRRIIFGLDRDSGGLLGRRKIDFKAVADGGSVA